MKIKRVRAKNFKSFAELDLELDDLNVFIGANASGKSNFVRIFDFLRNINEHGLDNAMSMEGGVEYLRNTGLKASENLEISVAYEVNLGFKHKTELRTVGVKVSEAEYKFVIKFHQRGNGFKIIQDNLVFGYEFVLLEENDDNWTESEQLGLGQGEIFVNSRQIVKTRHEIPKELQLSADDLVLPSFLPNDLEIPSQKLLLETPFFELAHRLNSPFSSFAIYDFDAKLPKRATSITGLKELEENGSNLSIVLKNISEDKEKKRKFLNLVGDLLPFINDFNVRDLADKSVLFTVNEEYTNGRSFIPASFVSDGTVNMLALIVALYFEDKGPVILEEPERNIHAHLISNLVNMFEDVSHSKQLIITTHNPEVVRFVPQEHLYLVSRNEQGYSEIHRPSEFEEVQVFLQNNIGIEELYVQDLLSVAHVK